MPPEFGLCELCVHQRVVPNTRGSRFSLCARAKTDDRYPRYPRMPVLRCAGYAGRPTGTEASGGSDR